MSHWLLITPGCCTQSVSSLLGVPNGLDTGASQSSQGSQASASSLHTHTSTSRKPSAPAVMQVCVYVMLISFYTV